MRGRLSRLSLSTTSTIIIIIIVAVAAIAGATILGPRAAPHASTASSQPTTSSITVTSSSAPAASTTSVQQLTLSSIESLNSSWVISLGPENSSKVIVIIYDPECPYCSLELNATLPFFYYVSLNTSQARVVFLGLPIHQYSVQMLEILYEVYKLYGPKAFVELLDFNYAYYTRNIELYLNHEVNQLVMPTNYTLIEMADELGFNVTQQGSNAWYPAVAGVESFLLSHNVSAIPTILAFNGSQEPVYYQVGLEQPVYLVGNLTERLDLNVPGLS